MPHDLTLQFFGQPVHVSCDSHDVAVALGAVYERQRVSGRKLHACRLRVCVEAHAAEGPRVIVGGRSVRAPSVDRLLHHAHLMLVNAAAASASWVQVLHAGAVERNGRAIVIVAPSGGGKTTLTLALVKRGWRVLSDDFAVLGPDGVVRPFLRRLNLTDQTIDLLGLPVPQNAVRVVAAAGVGKWMVDVDELAPGSVGANAALHAVFVTEPRAGASEPIITASSGVAARQDTETITWRLTVDRAPNGLVAHVSQIPGVRGVLRSSRSSATVLEVTVDRDARVVAALDDTLARFDAAALSASRTTRPTVTPGARPCLTPLELDEATMAILPHDLGLSGRRFLSGTNKTDVALSRRRLRSVLARTDAHAFRLWPGDLYATLDLIEQHANVP